jgi:MYXO-CTERM domain-containing protein
MKFKLLAASLALSMAGPAMAAACNSTANWGASSGSHGIGASFSSSGSYVGCYSFSLTSLTNSVSGSLSTTDPWLNKLDFESLAVQLFSGGVSGSGNTSSNLVRSDYEPSNFSFASLSAGTYTLAISANVSKDWGLTNSPVNYSGSVTTAGVSVASPAPEPESYALALAGLLGVGFAARRRKQG